MGPNQGCLDSSRAYDAAFTAATVGSFNPSHA